MLLHPQDRPLAGSTGQKEKSGFMPSNSFPPNLSLWPLRPYLSNFCPTHPTPGLPAIPQTHQAHAHLRAFALAGPSAQSPLPQSFPRLPPPFRSYLIPSAPAQVETRAYSLAQHRVRFLRRTRHSGFTVLGEGRSEGSPCNLRCPEQ